MNVYVFVLAQLIGTQQVNVQTFVFDSADKCVEYANKTSNSEEVLKHTGPLMIECQKTKLIGKRK